MEYACELARILVILAAGVHTAGRETRRYPSQSEALLLGIHRLVPVLYVITPSWAPNLAPNTLFSRGFHTLVHLLAPA